MKKCPQAVPEILSEQTDMHRPFRQPRRALPWGQRHAFFSGLLILLFAGITLSPLPLRALNDYQAGQEAMQMGVPEIAIVKFQTYLAKDSLDETLKKEAQLALANAFLQTGQPQEAKKLLEHLETDHTELSAQKQFLLGQTFAALANWELAAAAYQSSAEQSAPGTPAQAQAQFGLGQALRAQEHLDEARKQFQQVQSASASDLAFRAGIAAAELELLAGNIEKTQEILQNLSPEGASETQLKNYLQARLFLAREQWSEAITGYQNLIESPEGLPSELFEGSYLGLARAYLANGQRDQAEVVLENFVDTHESGQLLPSMFSELTRIYNLAPNTSTSLLRRWRDLGQGMRAELAALYLGRTEALSDDPEEALQAYQFVIDHSKNPEWQFQAYLEKTQLYAHIGTWEEADQLLKTAQEVFPEKEAQLKIAFTRALALHSIGKFEEAQEAFQNLATSEPTIAEIALYNQALCLLEMNDYERFLKSYAKFSENFPESPLRSNLLLEEALQQARMGAPETQETLRTFIQDFPQHPRVSEAYVTLAELAFTNTPPNLESAQLFLAEAEQKVMSPVAREASAFLRIFLAAAQPDQTALAVERANTFLNSFPTSSRAVEARLKLGEIYFNTGNFPSAHTQFDLIASEANQTHIIELALFLSGQSAVRSMNADALDTALENFEAVVQMNGPLRPRARLQQSAIKARQNKFDEAIILCEDGLQEGVSLTDRLELMLAKAEAIYASAQDSTETYHRAAEAFRMVADFPDAPTPIRNQALWKTAQALEKAGDFDHALTTYFDAFAPNPEAEEQPEFFWYYKSAFDAARILESREKWESAVGIYTRLANLNGPRASEARTRLNRLRLEHFLWEE